MVSDERNVERKSYRVASITAGDYNDDSRYAEWQQVNGNVTPTRPALMAYKSELFNAYQVTLDADRASSAATNHALQLAASDLEYEGTRVKSPVLGRDLNPMGRGNGVYYADGGNTHGGSVAVGRAKPTLIGIVTGGYGSSVNNDCASPPAECFSACICSPLCMGPWYKRNRTGKPTECCDDPDQIEMAIECCLSDADAKDPDKRKWFIEQCLGCVDEPNPCSCVHLSPPPPPKEVTEVDRACASYARAPIESAPPRGPLDAFLGPCTELCLCRWIVSLDGIVGLGLGVIIGIIDCLRRYPKDPLGLIICIVGVLIENKVKIPWLAIISILFKLLAKHHDCNCQAAAIYSCNQFWFDGPMSGDKCCGNQNYADQTGLWSHCSIKPIKKAPRRCWSSSMSGLDCGGFMS